MKPSWPRATLYLADRLRALADHLDPPEPMTTIMLNTGGQLAHVHRLPRKTMMRVDAELIIPGAVTHLDADAAIPSAGAYWDADGGLWIDGVRIGQMLDVKPWDVQHVYTGSEHPHDTIVTSTRARGYLDLPIPS